jgi:O-antigen/teichoic acid export membrane protein
MQPADASLRRRALQGGAYLVARRGISIVLGLVGAVILVRLVGPEAYGLFNAGYGIFNYLLSLGVMGVHVYLIREKEDSLPKQMDLAFWWLLFFGSGLTGLALLALWWIGYRWAGDSSFVGVALLICLNLPLTLISYTPLVLLERELDYRRTTFVEAGGQVLYYVVALPLALMGHGVWSLVAGFWANQLMLTVGYFAATRYRPRWWWDWSRLKPMLSYSFMQAVPGWLYNLRETTPSILLMPLAGQAAVGYWAIANRFANLLGFAREAAGRLSIPAFARVQDDRARLTRAVSEAMQLQTLSLGVFFVAFALAAPFVLPALLGPRWSVTDVLAIFAIVALRLQLSSLFTIQGNALSVKGHNLILIYTNLIYILIFLGLGFIGLWLLPPAHRLLGYAVADLVAHLPTYWLRHRGMTRYIGRPDYRVSILWIGATACGLLAPLIHGGLLAVMVLLLLHPLSLRAFRQLRSFKQPVDQSRSSSNQPPSYPA